MGNFRRNNDSSRRRGGGGFSGRSSGRPEMHRVVCSECGKDCEVPFKPSSNKPVFCDDCFRGRAGADQKRGGRDSGRFGSSDKRMHDAICDECGKSCQVPFKPTSGKPIYCSECFGKTDKGDRGDRGDRGSRRSRDDRGDKGGRDRGFDQSSKQFDIINSKLDKILESLDPAISTEVKEPKKPVKKAKIVKLKKPNKDKGKPKKEAIAKESKVKPKAKPRTKAKPKINKKK